MFAGMMHCVQLHEVLATCVMSFAHRVYECTTCKHNTFGKVGYEKSFTHEKELGHYLEHTHRLFTLVPYGVPC